MSRRFADKWLAVVLGIFSACADTPAQAPMETEPPDVEPATSQEQPEEPWLPDGGAEAESTEHNAEVVGDEGDEGVRAAEAIQALPTASGEPDPFAECGPITPVWQEGALPEWRGAKKAKITKCLGSPDEREKGVWVYRWPKGCTDWRTILEIRFERGVVVQARAERDWTGQHCAEAF
jgi:hypothetical protein